MKPLHTVSVVIPVWNNWELTSSCLHSLREHTPGPDFQVILADNGSTDQTPDEAPLLGKSLFGEHFTYLRLTENLGFAKACNEGAWASSAEYLYFLNNDTLVTPNWLPPLLKAMKGDPRLAGVGPLLLFPDDGTVRSKRVQHLGIAVSYGMEFRHLYEYFPHTHPAVTKQRRLNVVTAAALLMPTRLFKAENGFFAGFVNGMEDVDLCCRIARQGGYFSIIPQSVTYHLTHGTEGRFDHESDNLRLLRRRCRHAKADLYDLILADGFEPGFTPWLELMVRLPEERTEELARHLDDPTTEHLFALLEREPLWAAGYDTLFRMLADQGRLTEAMPVAYFRSLLCPSLQSFADCERIMRQCNIPDMADKYAATIRDMQRTMADRKGLARKARNIMQTVQYPTVQAALEAFLDD
ncbi:MULTISPECIES: glycosyltransferase family 2 protein [unclassified Pseudodesulfovibrio]|uniref:glycosyltransferase family 2 protein n=1 Tax=unclassified Pseudodesulfovibrio TaxID=2661612 RepID=UPI000FEBA955|nr:MULTISPECIES: glycosyltransferase family 2 protein [unclassified Pseudodesulfovibrio]MCJ2165629.1 glycosyltransferase family 2 protein [Pseudodesulfovibrio sp. S3-i]RWU03036.1 glycosyltransferase family 2 protein [Pseudodesulfovibrio sp. S3]